MVRASKVLPVPVSPTRTIFDFSISEEDMEFLDGLNENLATGWDPTDAP